MKNLFIFVLVLLLLSCGSSGGGGTEVVNPNRHNKNLNLDATFELLISENAFKNSLRLPEISAKLFNTIASHLFFLNSNKAHSENLAKRYREIENNFSKFIDYTTVIIDDNFTEEQLNKLNNDLKNLNNQYLLVRKKLYCEIRQIKSTEFDYSKYLDKYGDVKELNELRQEIYNTEQENASDYYDCNLYNEQPEYKGKPPSNIIEVISN